MYSSISSNYAGAKIRTISFNDIKEANSKLFANVLFAVTFFIVVITASTQAQETLPDTARIPIIVNVDAIVTVTPPADANGAVGTSKNVTANTPDTLVVVLEPSDFTSASHGAQVRPNTPEIRRNRGSVSLRLSPQLYNKATVSLYTVNGKRVLSGKADASKSAVNISRSNIAAGVYLLHVKGAAKNSYATRLTHSGGKLNINVAFGGESVTTQTALAKAKSTSEDWTVSVQAQTTGYSDTSYVFSPVKGINPVQEITLRIPTFAVDISSESEDWKYMVVGGDGSMMFIDVDESNEIPTRIFLKPDKDVDNGITMLFKENGLPDKMVVDGHILIFGNFNGNKFDLAIVYPNDSIEYLLDIETEVNWDEYVGASGLTKARSWKSFFDNPRNKVIFSVAVPIVTCGIAIKVPLLIKVCGASVISLYSDIAHLFIDQIPNGDVADALHFIVDAKSCAKFYFGDAWENIFSMLGGINDANTCVAAVTKVFSQYSYNDLEIINENITRREEINEFFKNREDSRYETLVLGGKEWTTRNLNFELPDSWCYNNDPENCKTYGRLYEYEAAMVACPALGDGWRLPNNNDWNSLIYEAAGSPILENGYSASTAKKLMATIGWSDYPGNGTDDFGFSVLPSGYLYGNYFRDIGSRSYFWSATKSGSNTSNSPYYVYIDGYVQTGTAYSSDRYSVRCVRDIEPKTIGKWTKSNLNVETPESWCYDDDPENCEKYGRLYSWNAAKIACNSLGSGWRLPNDDDWIALVSEAGGSLLGATKLKSNSYWDTYSGIPTGTDDLEFMALPAGFRSESNGFIFFMMNGFWGGWWSSTVNDAGEVYVRYIAADNTRVYGHWIEEDGHARSVRCIRDD